MKPQIELREENGKLKAYRPDGREIPIPSFPKAYTDSSKWLGGLSTDVLEAARQFYLDKWTWDDANEDYRILVDLIERHQRLRTQLQQPLSQMGNTTLDLSPMAVPFRQMTSRSHGEL